MATVLSLVIIFLFFFRFFLLFGFTLPLWLSLVASCQSFPHHTIHYLGTANAMHIVYVDGSRDQGPLLGRVSMAMYTVAVAFVALR
jgi:hypothetical protein